MQHNSLRSTSAAYIVHKSCYCVSAEHPDDDCAIASTSSSDDENYVPLSDLELVDEDKEEDKSHYHEMEESLILDSYEVSVLRFTYPVSF